MSCSYADEEVIDLVIVGSGISGLICAEEAIKAGLTVKILEARDRIGGRLSSFEGIDLGAAWGFPPYETEAVKLAKRLSVPVVEQRLDGDSFMLRPSGVMQNVGENGGRMAPCGPSAVRFRGGYSELPRLLSESMSSNILREMQVTAVEYIKEINLIRISTNSSTAFNAKRVVFALPPAVLAKSISFTPSLPISQKWKMEETMTWCGDWCKIVVIFKTPFWRDLGASGVVSTQGELISIWYEGGSGLEGEAAAITGLGFGEAVCVEVASLLKEDAALEKYVIASLAAALGGEKTVKDQIVKIGGKSWAMDELTYAHDARGRDYGHTLLRQPTDWGVYFAGTETEAMNGHVEGAIVAGRRAAREVVGSL
eukprot:TRINITY_DN80716_c0_g1_i1.p1 TRINITY_DN80716_c0_g1~~TRINITY_DN80716_c0_g1_i1.p1  ORF type:complete len:404 (-),score=54.23 TRINITY_DN80716_c0_g1_i1:377-1480(-)